MTATPSPLPQSDAPEPDLFCPGCGYDLRALTSEACPECGAVVDMEKLRKSSIPWVLGEGFFGKAWGFVKTSERTIFKPSRFCNEVARPMSLKQARWFRRIVVLIAWLTLIAMAVADWVIIVYIKGQTDDLERFFLDYGIHQAYFYAALVGLLLLFLVGLTGIHLYAMHPRSLPIERQNRAVALGHYACGTLAMLPAVFILRVVSAFVANHGESTHVRWLEDTGFGVWAATSVLTVLLFFLFMRNTYTFAGKPVQRSGFGQAGLALVFPLLWVGWGLVVFVALPAVAGFIYLFFITR